VTGTDGSLDEIVATLAPRVLEDAMEKAVVQARDELADRLARAIVDRAVSMQGVNRKKTIKKRKKIKKILNRYNNNKK